MNTESNHGRSLAGRSLTSGRLKYKAGTPNWILGGSQNGFLSSPQQRLFQGPRIGVPFRIHFETK